VQLRTFIRPFDIDGIAVLAADLGYTLDDLSGVEALPLRRGNDLLHEDVTN
jgi:hypothetical protein